MPDTNKIVQLAFVLMLLLSSTLLIKPTKLVVPEKRIEIVKAIESSNFANVSDIPWEHELSNAIGSYETWHSIEWDFERAEEWSDFACVDEDSAELVIGIQKNRYAELTDLITRCGSELVNTISIGGEIKAVISDVPFVAMSRFMAEARATGLSRYIEPKMRFNVNFVPNDPYRVLQSDLDLIEADSAWNITTGDRHILVAIVDTGIDYNHPDLAANYVALGYDWVNDDPDPMDDNGHGTHCAGIIAAGLNNSMGISRIGAGPNNG